MELKTKRGRNSTNNRLITKTFISVLLVSSIFQQQKHEIEI